MYKQDYVIINLISREKEEKTLLRFISTKMPNQNDLVKILKDNKMYGTNFVTFECCQINHPCIKVTTIPEAILVNLISTGEDPMGGLGIKFTSPAVVKTLKIGV